MQHAVKGLESPGVLLAFFCRHLEGAFEVFAQEDAGGAAVVVGVGDDGGVHDDAAEGVFVGFLLAVEPGIGRLVVGVHVGDDLGGVLEDIFGVQLIDPGAVDTAGGAAVGPVAALDLGGLL